MRIFSPKSDTLTEHPSCRVLHPFRRLLRGELKLDSEMVVFDGWQSLKLGRQGHGTGIFDVQR